MYVSIYQYLSVPYMSFFNTLRTLPTTHTRKRTYRLHDDERNGLRLLRPHRLVFSCSSRNNKQFSRNAKEQPIDIVLTPIYNAYEAKRERYDLHKARQRDQISNLSKHIKTNIPFLEEL